MWNLKNNTNEPMKTGNEDCQTWKTNFDLWKQKEEGGDKLGEWD